MTTKFITITSESDDVLRVRGIAESALAVLENKPVTRWPDLNDKLDQAEALLTELLDAANDSIAVNDIG